MADRREHIDQNQSVDTSSPGGPWRWFRQLERLSYQQQARVAEATVQARLLIHGWEVYGSQFDGDSADWLATRPGGPTYRIQVRLLSIPHRFGRPFLRLAKSSSRARYGSADADFLCGFCPVSGECHVFKFDEIGDRKCAISTSVATLEAWHKIEYPVEYRPPAQVATAPARVATRRPPRHGTYNRYRRGCRCDRCRRAQGDRVAKWRRTKKAATNADAA